MEVRDFEEREARQADMSERWALQSKILGTPSPEVHGVVNLDDPSQARLLESVVRRVVE